MKKTTLTVSYDEEKMAALKLYMEQKGTAVEKELAKALDTLYAKSVPAGVREFIALRSGNATESSTSKVQKQKISPSGKPQETKPDGQARPKI